MPCLHHRRRPNRACLPAVSVAVPLIHIDHSQLNKPEAGQIGPSDLAADGYQHQLAYRFEVTHHLIVDLHLAVGFLRQGGHSSREWLGEEFFRLG
jgi:hypothetical protein